MAESFRDMQLTAYLKSCGPMVGAAPAKALRWGYPEGTAVSVSMDPGAVPPKNGVLIRGRKHIRWADWQASLPDGHPDKEVTK